MSDTYTIVVGDKGRLVMPAEVRARHGWHLGDRLVAVDTPTGVLLTDRARLLSIVRAQLAGTDLVAELLTDRRAEAASDDRR